MNTIEQCHWTQWVEATFRKFMDFLSNTSSLIRWGILGSATLAWFCILFGALVFVLLVPSIKMHEAVKARAAAWAYPAVVDDKITEEKFWMHQISALDNLVTELRSLRRDVERIRTLQEKQSGR